MVHGIRLRLLALLSFIVLSFFFGVLFFRTQDAFQLRRLVLDVKQGKADTFKQVVALKGQSLQALAHDYTSWDEMVKLVEEGNLEFAKQNLDGSLGTYNVDRLWVYRLDGTATYQIVQGPDGRAIPAGGSLLSPAMIEKALGGDTRFCHFFLMSEQGPIEIRGATIHPAADQERRTPPRGYFFAGRVWNEPFLRHLGALSTSTVEIELPRADGSFTPVPRDTVDEVHFSESLAGLDGRPAFRLNSASKLAFLGQLNASASDQLVLQTVFFIVFLAIISVLINAWVTSPLSAVSRALDDHQPRHLDRVLSKQNEFGRLARLVQRYFAQEERLQEAMKVKSEFTSMVSHELRTPLSVITECIAIVHDGIPGPVNAEQKDFLETARRNVDRLNRMVNEVLDYQKLESQRMEFHWAESDTNELVEESARGFELLAKAKGLSLVSMLGADLPPVRVDRDKIAQVLNNFLNNAVKFTECGAITVKTGRTADGYVRVAITDEGIGIKEQDIAKLFQSFSQVSSGAGRKTGGTGLGLAISRQIIERHGGKIGVESVYGQGSTFYFALPAR